MSAPTDLLVTDAAALGTCALSDALDALQLPGVLAGIRAQSGVIRTAGRAVTVELGSAGDAAATSRHLCTAAVDHAGPGDVIVVAHPGPHEGPAPAGWGGILSLSAWQRGIAGVIVGGLARDLDDARELGFAVFARGATPVTARGRVVEKSWNEPIEVGGVSVVPGDIVIADENGVVRIPGDRAREVVDRARSVAAREEAIARAVRAGTPASEAMGQDYEGLLT